MEYPRDNYSIQDNEEEEGVALKGRQSTHPSQEDNNNSNATAVVISVDGNGGDGSSISRSGSSTISSDVDQSNSENGTTNEGDRKDGEEDDSTVHSSVYFDKLNGIWKCRHCNWTYCVGSPWNDHIQKHRGHLHVLTNIKNCNQQEPSFVFETDEGAQSIDEVSNVEVNGASSIISEIVTNKMAVILENSEIQNIMNKELILQSGGILDDEGFSGSTSLKGSFADQQSNMPEPSDHAAITAENLEIIEEIDEEGTDYDVKKVLEKQNTHDLYCPNCHSCITRKVILHRRRRKIRTARRKPRQERLEAIVDSEKDAHSTPSANDQRRDAENIRERDQEVFTCLSCFSFFIPTGDGFKLFRFGDKKRDANVQDSQKIPASNNRNWFFSIFTSDKTKTPTEQDGLSSALLEGSTDVLPQEGSDNSRAPLSDGDMVNNGQLAEDTSVKHYQDTPARPLTEGNEKPAQADQAPLLPGSLLPAQLYPKGGLVVDNTFKGGQMLDTVAINIGEKAFGAMENNNTGNDVIVTIEKGQEEAADSQRVENIGGGGSVEDTSLPISGIRIDTHVGEQRDAGTGAAHEWEILKSIVYGGLTESITSLGVVTSAAGSGATTLNILALGLANLIGGLFVICHNLVDLKNDHHGETSSEPNQQEDRYRKTLGRRENFLLHATIAILSFIVFGLLPPVIYGFSFRTSGSRDLKLAAVGGASLVCIILLAIGKAHVQRQPKKYISTVFYYVTIGFTASGASYIAGDLLDMLLQKLGYSDFEPGLAVTSFSSTPKPSDLAWASY